MNQAGVNRADVHDIEAGKSNGRILLGLALCLMFIALGAWFVGFFGPIPGSDGEGIGGRLAAIFNTSEENVSTVIGWICIILFGVFALIHIKLLLLKGPALKVNDQGVWMARWRTDPVAWDYIDRITQISVSGQHSFGVFLTENGRGALGRKKPMMSKPDFYLNPVGTQTSFDAVRDYIRATHPLLLEG